ncbi:ligase-associated DNA damage response endonuclease PdeM [Burkholderia gladioli]|uniref:ligase-associated DNA damage response endonuclease PdeM n=1 Tax=Burkholderia gladioli TaxID=28095 RepID=UPI000D008339|nr:ligase-associated DNA damage response endonuclease PdeM [Burkholderia gladioli]MBJ9674836.1 ligase-associated DNA damage response endonuclease PdeM [Burkholderia gladioli]MBU9269845.1 ligase-associated DNA damage response endonuclease PdeM [Burkholderia gladioli]MBU9274024.1 ligase-associated DNA damage response endonuclease PdeM [Burkholderia gladioli]MBU9687360.1 ligase-associated DNA damage response endonuclease PdeM [Burkholderia gladioli]MCA8168954.1 ligase-associated DNA damage respon
MSADALAIELNGHPLMLSAKRAAFDPVRGCLLVADAHLGKDAVFRARGIPVPAGSTGETLARLDRLIATYLPESIVFLGDLLHARESHADDTLAPLRAWRRAHRGLRLVLVEGNHDRHAGSLAAEFGVETVAEPYRLGPWALCHHPGEIDGAYALAGHEHPVLALKGQGDRLRLPCFRFGARAGVLPAFGAFTGGHDVGAPRADERRYVIGGDRVFRVGA